ncbi:MAG: hypothetical protein KGI08_10565, partial [Thaumarchaeota archaeon]|nr:hypothetical protein [Nitrososphaerota archaeon]
MDVCGVNLVVTHPGFDGVTNFFGWFNISNPGSPIWNAGNIQSTGTINSFGAISAGSGGTNGTYNNVALSGGTGFAAIANIVVSGNAVTSVTIVSGGLGYLVGDVLSAPPATIGGVTGFSVPVASLQPSAIVLTTVPSWVVQYNGRACFGINPPTGLPSMVMTNSLSLGVTNANQALTFGDNTILVGAAGMPLNNQLGGIIASIMVFKDDSNIAQITGDFSTSNLAINTLNVAIGTIGIRSVSKSPKGLVFCAADGIRYIDQNAQVSDPIGVAGSGVNVPFRYALNTSRMAASCNATVFRISIQSGTFAGNPWIEYWFDIPRQQWSGPHTFPAACIDVYDNNFIMSAVGINAALFTSNPIPNNLSMYTENSVALQFVFQTAMLRDPIKIASYRISELIVKLGYDNNSLTMNIAQ